MVSSHEGFFNLITKQYGRRTTGFLKTWLTTQMKICTQRQQLIFLLRCRRYNVKPPHIYNLQMYTAFHSYSVNRSFNELKSRTKKTLLNMEIKDMNYNLTFLRKENIKIETQIRFLLPNDIANNFFLMNKDKINKHDTETKNRLIKKFNNILNKYHTEYDSFFKFNHSKWIVNVSSKKIPDSVSRFLSLGDRFSLPIDPKNKDDRLLTVVNVIKNLEANAYKFGTKTIEETRNDVSNNLQRFLRANKHIDYLDRHILREHKECKKFLHLNDDVLVTKADKGQVTVIMDKTLYLSKMTELLDDDTKYKKIKKDPINQLTNKVKNLIKTWLDNNIIDERTYKNLNCNNGNLPRCYGLPKVHKTGLPLRIIVSSLGSPIYKMARFLHEILETSVIKPRSHIKDSWAFTKLIQNRRIEREEILLSLDVTALFNNIPKELVIKAIEKRWLEISQKTFFNLQQFLYAIELVLSSTSFSFNGQFYEQIFGSPMGSPLSPILADLVMDDLETFCLEQLEFEVNTYYRYVDDVFTIIPNNKIDDILK
ncbi:PREDICTED: uncharacterized protein LOC105558566, partial [Vollenhovia emeryi]|uniref:uncharacterized protein LOC105558566 n=1 Tax=Vollenhovia emeryi TaxID=411798 RepID=UPI0005F471E9